MLLAEANQLESSSSSAAPMGPITKRAPAARVLHVQRRPFPGQFSIENLFAALRRAQPLCDCHVDLMVVPHYSKGFFRRVANCWAVFCNRKEVNHITGDIHYVGLLLPPGRTILTIHDCLALERLRGVKRWVMKVLWFDLPIRRARFVTVISEESKEQLLRHVAAPTSKLVVIPDCVSPAFRPGPKPFNRDCPRILQIGTKPNKNLPRLIEALRGIPCHLHIVGRLSEQQAGDLETAGIEYSTSCDLTEAEMVQAYCDADLVAFVSTYEGFGLPILEANAVGRPVVTSNTSSMPEVAGDAACLVDPLDAASIRQGLLRVIGEPNYRDSLIRNGFANVLRFRPDAVAAQYAAIYAQIRSEIKS